MPRSRVVSRERPAAQEPAAPYASTGANRKLRECFDRHDSDRTGLLNRARDCAALTKPSILPPIGQNANDKLPENFQSLGSRAELNLTGKILLSVYPPGVPWFKQEVDPSLVYGGSMTEDQIEASAQALFLQDVITIGELEDAGGESNRTVSSFRTNKRKSISSIIVTGDSLERMNDDLSLTIFRRDQYVNKLDSSGNVRYHVTKEEIDYLTLSDRQLVRLNKNRVELSSKPSWERCGFVYTMVEWQPNTKKWTVCQEIDGFEIVDSEEKVTPFIWTPFDLAPGEDYGRGLIEANLGDLKSLDELSLRALQLAEIASKVTPVIDAGSSVKETDLTRPSGVPIRARVRGGTVEDLALMQSQKGPDASIVENRINKITEALGAAFLIDSAAVRDSERTTKFEISEVTIKELEGALGGVYAPIADRNQRPTAARALHLLRLQKKLPILPKNTTKLRAITGIAALTRQAEASRMLDFVQTVAILGPEAIARINTDVLLNNLARLKSVSTPGLIKSPEEVKAELQQAMAAQAQVTATQKAIDVSGNVAQAQATAGLPTGKAA